MKDAIIHVGCPVCQFLYEQYMRLEKLEDKPVAAGLVVDLILVHDQQHAK